MAVCRETLPTPFKTPTKKVSTATRAPVCGASIWRSRYSGLNRSKSLICSSERVSLRSAVAFSSRSSRSCLVNRLWRCQTPRMPPEETWMPRSISSWATRIGPWQGWVRAWSRIAVSISAATRLTWRRAGGRAAHRRHRSESCADLVELLPTVADHPARLADVAEIAGELQQAQLAAGYLLVCGHVVLRSRLECCSQHHPNLA